MVLKGIHTSGERCLVHFLENNFPSFRRGTDRLWKSDSYGRARLGLVLKTGGWRLKSSGLRWTVGSFKLYKSVGSVLIFLLQERLDLINESLTMILRA